MKITVLNLTLFLFTALALFQTDLFAEVKRESIKDKDGKLLAIVYSSGRKIIAKEVYDKDGSLSEKTGAIPDGKINEYYSDGRLWKEWNYKNNMRDGIVKVFYPNGSLSEEALFKANKREGVAKEFYENGNIKTEGDFKDGKLLSFKEYDRQGAVQKDTSKLPYFPILFALTGVALLYGLHRYLKRKK